MPNINFHIRKHYYYTEATDQLENAHAYIKDDASNFWYNDDSYTNQDEIFALTPSIMGGVTLTSAPTDTRAVYNFRLDDGVQSGVYPVDNDFGDMNSSTANQLKLAYNAGAANASYCDCIEATWTTNSWTVGTFDTFKNEVTTFLATGINNSRSLTGTSVQPLSQYADWAVQFYMNQIDGAHHFVIFYPGNDPQADEIIVEAV